MHVDVADHCALCNASTTLGLKLRARTVVRALVLEWLASFKRQMLNDFLGRCLIKCVLPPTLVLCSCKGISHASIWCACAQAAQTLTAQTVPLSFHDSVLENYSTSLCLLFGCCSHYSQNAVPCYPSKEKI